MNYCWFIVRIIKNPIQTYFKQNISITNFLNGGFQTKINIEQYITKIQSQNRNNSFRKCFA